MKKGFIIFLMIILAFIAIGGTGSLIFLLRNGSADWGFYMGNDNLTIQKEEEFDINALQKLIVKNFSSDISILKSETDKIKIVQKSQKTLDNDELFKSNLENGVLTIAESFTPKFRFFYFNTTHYDVYLPEQYLESIAISSTSGNIESNTALALKDIILKTTSGNVTILGKIASTGNVSAESTSGNIYTNSTITANSLYMKSTSGNVTDTESCTLIGELTMQSTSGNVLSNGNLVCDFANIFSTSGDVKVSMLTTKNASTIKSTSGRVHLDNFKGFGTVKCTSGDVRINQFEMLGNSDISSLSGNVTLKMSENSNCDIYDKTTSGRVTISNDVRRMGNPPYSILNVKTTSGNIKVEK